MAYIAPRTWATGELVTAAMMNQDVRDNMIAVKAQADTIYTATVTDYTGAGRALETEYQNGSKIRIVMVSLTMTNPSQFEAYIGAASPAATEIVLESNVGAGNSKTIVFVVPADWYYTTLKVVGGSTINTWFEFDLF